MIQRAVASGNRTSPSLSLFADGKVPHVFSDRGNLLVNGAKGVDVLSSGFDNDGRLNGGAGNDMLNGSRAAEIIVSRDSGDSDKIVDFSPRLTAAGQRAQRRAG